MNWFELAKSICYPHMEAELKPTPKVKVDRTLTQREAAKVRELLCPQCGAELKECVYRAMEGALRTVLSTCPTCGGIYLFMGKNR